MFRHLIKLSIKAKVNKESEGAKHVAAHTTSSITKMLTASSGHLKSKEIEIKKI